MREILFRGKRKDNGEWVEGYFSKRISALTEYTTIDRKEVKAVYNQRTEYMYTRYSVIPETVGQCTGLTDKNGKKIFEGDILNCITSDFDGRNKYVYNFKIIDITNFEQMGFLDFCNEIEIIGNIHDNPRIVKGA